DKSVLRLQHIDCDIADSCITLLVGQTGSGKSTMLQVLCGLIPVSEGEIRYNDQPLWDRNRASVSIRQQTGIVFQSPEQQFFASMVKEEFEYSLRYLKQNHEANTTTIRQTMESLNLPM